jgi:hypothetical protein
MFHVLGTEIFNIIIDSSFVLCDGTIIDNGYHVAKGVKEVLVMGDNNETTFVALEGLDKGVDGIVVQMICGLIQ